MMARSRKSSSSSCQGSCSSRASCTSRTVSHNSRGRTSDTPEASAAAASAHRWLRSAAAEVVADDEVCGEGCEAENEGENDLALDRAPDRESGPGDYEKQFVAADEVDGEANEGAGDDAPDHALDHYPRLDDGMVGGTNGGSVYVPACRISRIARPRWRSHASQSAKAISYSRVAA